MQQPKHLLSVLLLLFLSSNAAYAQHHRHHHPRTHRSRHRSVGQGRTYSFADDSRFTIRIVPTGLLNRFSAGLPVGAGVMLNKRWAVSAEVMMPFYQRFRVSGLGLSDEELHTSSRYRVELRHYLAIRQHTRFFLALEGFHAATGYTERNGVYIDDSWEEYYYRYAEVKKSVTGFGMLAGFNLHITDRFCMDVAGGLGFKSVQVERTDVVPAYKQSSHQYLGSFRSEDEVSGHRVLAYIPVMVGLSYGFGHTGH